MYKKCKVVILATKNKPTKDSHGDIYHFSDGIKNNNKGKYLFYGNGLYKPRGYDHLVHLYILSDDIAKGDYLIDDNGVFGPYEEGDIPVDGWLGKIIATTDTSLIKGIRWNKEIPLPQIPESFISLFIEEYNKGNMIKKVKVEYEECSAEGCNGTGTIAYPIAGEFECCDCNGEGEELKLNPDNTINIKIVKDILYTEKEVKILCLDLAKYYGHFITGNYHDDYGDVIE